MWNVYIARHHEWHRVHPGAFVILPNCSRDVILGMDFITDNGVIIDLQCKSVSFSADHAMTPKPSPEQRMYFSKDCE